MINPPPGGHLGSDSREGDPKSRGATNARPDARGNEVWSENAQGNSLSVTGCTRKEKMPNAWRGSGQRSSLRQAQRQLPARPLHRRSQGTASSAWIINPRGAKNGDIAGLRRCMGLMLRFHFAPSPPAIFGQRSSLDRIYGPVLESLRDRAITRPVA